MKFGLYVYVLATLLSAAPLSEGKKLKGYRKPASTIVETGTIYLIDTIPRESDASTSKSASISSHLDDSRGASTTGRRATIGGVRASDSDLNSAQRELASMDPFNDELDKPFAAFQQCFESCGVPWKLEAFGRVGDSTDSVATDFEKQSCCKGGVSAIKMVYSGVNGASLFFPDDESLANSPIVDPCGEGDGESSKKPKKSADPWLVKFADCDRCFPKDGSPVLSCDPSTDIWESVGVDEHDEVCVISYDEVSAAAAFGVKMPTNLILFYQLVDSVTIGSLNIHTSCSKPIYPPYAVQFGVCSNDDDAYVDLSVPGIQDLLSNSSLLQFEDGVSANNPGALFTSCEATKNEDQDCCDGGASFLKMAFGGDFSGIITLDASAAGGYSSCDLGFDEDAPGPTTKKSGAKHVEKDEDSDLRFVSCSDECLLNPVGNVSCSYSFQSMSVGLDEAICLGMWDSNSNRILYNEKMPTNVDIFFIADDSSLNAFSARVHTSCSNPIFEPYAQPFSDVCDTQEPVIRLENSAEDLPFPFLRFVDGFSRRFFQAAQAVEDSSIDLLFDWSFAGCGCSCQPSDAPSCDLSNTSRSPTCPPSNAPTVERYSVPSTLPSSSPTVLETRSPTVNPSAFPTSSPASPEPSSQPSPENTLYPSVHPTVQPTTLPTAVPTGSPSVIPSLTPSTTVERYSVPSTFPSSSPTVLETGSPTVNLSALPTSSPTSSEPSSQPSPPSPESTQYPSDHPTVQPTSLPTARPTGYPSVIPSLTPSTLVPGNNQKGPGGPGPGGPGSSCANKCKGWVYLNCVRLGDGGSLLGDEPCDVDQAMDGDLGPPDDDSGEDGRRLYQRRLEALSESHSGLYFRHSGEELDYHEEMVSLYNELLSLIESL